MYAPSLDLLPEVDQVLNQGQIGSCTVHACLDVCEMYSPRTYSRLYPFYNERAGYGALGTDGGRIEWALQTLSVNGTPEEKYWPYDLSKVNVRPPDILYSWAPDAPKRYQVQAYNKVFGWPDSLDMATVKDYLSRGIPVIIAIAERQGLLNVSPGSWKTHTWDYESTVIGSHAITIIGYDDSVQRWLIMNSWGPEYADGGFVGIPYSVMTRDCQEAWVITKFDSCIGFPHMTTSSARVFLGKSDYYVCAISGVSVFGSVGDDTLQFLPDVYDVKLDANVDKIILPQPKAAYAFVTDAQFSVTQNGRSVLSCVSLNQPMQIKFADCQAAVVQTGATTFEVK